MDDAGGRCRLEPEVPLPPRVDCRDFVEEIDGTLVPSRQNQAIETDTCAVLHDTSRMRDVVVAEALQLASVEVQQSRRCLVSRQVLMLRLRGDHLPSCSEKRIEPVRLVTSGQDITDVAFDVSDLKHDKQIEQASLCQRFDRREWY